jgi:hypothetical protein
MDGVGEAMKRSTKRAHLRALSRICRQLGGTLAIVSQRAYDDLFDDPDAEPTDGELHESPFTSAYGLHWRRKIVYVVRGREEVGSVIHEMGHVFADVHHPEDRKCHEWDWFGWEIALARQISAGQTWSRHNSNYATREGGGGDWGTLSAKRRRAVVADRLAYARKIGVIDTNDCPRSVR